MIDCVVLGDSIAVGIGSASHCQVIAKVGINSKNFVVSHKYIPKANKTVISLGSNDGNADFSKYLRELRSKVSGEVVWILSVNNARARKIALKIARQNGDSVVYLSSFATADGVHPKSYKAVAAKVF